MRPDTCRHRSRQALRSPGLGKVLDADSRLFITNAKNLMFMTIHKRQKRIVYLQLKRMYCAQAHHTARSFTHISVI